MYPWLAERAQLVIGPQFRAIAAIDKGGKIAGMVGYDAFTKTACSMHVAFDSPMALRSLIGPAFRVAFDTLGKKVVFGTVLSTNKKALKLDRHLGFREVARLKDAWDEGVGYVLFEMRREDCRWLKEAH